MFNSLRRFSILYSVIMLVYMISIYLDLVLLHNVLKPLFMPLLILFVVKQSGGGNRFIQLIVFGLFFSWIGDVALMIDKTGMWFILGLGSFLIAHLGYSLGFYLNIKSSSKPINSAKMALLAVPFLLVTVPFFLYIKDGLIFTDNGVEKNLTVPVLAYTVVITLMGVFSAWRTGRVNKKTFNWMLIGAVLFILSDCVLALNLFSIRPEPNSDMSVFLRICNMLLYLSGQLMIAAGAVFNSPEKQD